MKPCTPTNGCEGSPPADGISSTKNLTPPSWKAWTFHGPVMAYGARPLANASLAMSKVTSGLMCPASPHSPSCCAKAMPPSLSICRSSAL